MAKKKKPGKRSPSYVIFARVEPEMGEALERYIASLDPKPTHTSAVRKAVREMLEAAGFWPPPSPPDSVP